MSPIVTLHPVAPLVESGRLPNPISPSELLELPTPEFEPCDAGVLDDRDESERRSLESSRRELGLESGWYYEDSEPTLGASLPSSPEGRAYVP